MRMWQTTPDRLSGALIARRQTRPAGNGLSCACTAASSVFRVPRSINHGGEGDAIAVVLLLRHDLIQVVVDVVQDGPVRGRIFAALHARLAGHLPIAPVKVELADPRRAAAGVVGFLGEVAIADAAVVVDVA